MEGVKEDVPALFEFFKLVKAFHETVQILEDGELSLHTENCSFDLSGRGILPDLDIFAVMIIGGNRLNEIHKFSLVPASSLTAAYFHTWAHAGLYLYRK